MTRLLGDRLISRSQLGRLFRLVLELQTESYPRADDLAELCGVSRRTIYRDLDVLSQAGLPVRYRNDRMGYELDPAFWLATPDLTDDEVMALVTYVRLCDAPIPSMVHDLALQGLQKIVAALPRVRGRLGVNLFNRLSQRRRRHRPEFDQRLFVALLGALARGKQIRLHYRGETGAGDGGDMRTLVHPYRLERRGKQWWLVGRSSYHRRRERFALEHMVELVELDEPAVLPARLNGERSDPAANPPQGVEFPGPVDKIFDSPGA
jgi:predicted DNA-binding transcriptional regulator YafY